MKETSFLAKLLDGEKVEWKSLGEVCEVLRGSRLTKKELSDEYQYPVFHGGLIPLGYYNQYNRNANQTMIINTGSIGEVVWSSVDFWSSDGTFVVKTPDEIDDRFLYFFLKINETYFKSQKREGGVPTINREAIANLQIPIPCPENPKKSLEIQAEIVRILDNFTTLTAELTAELTARKKQYSYYRDQLLTFAEGEVEWKPLGEVLIRSKGTQITAGKMRQLHKDGAPIKIFAGGRTIAFVNFDDIPAKDINNKPSIIVKSRGIIAFEYYEKPFSHKNEMWSYYSDNKNIDIKFVYYFLKLNEQHFQNIGSKMQMPQIATPDTDKFKIPIPPLSQQVRIVSILDKFDALTNSITEGLPREIELRTKQYEYYRDLLLNFPKNEVVK